MNFDLADTFVGLIAGIVIGWRLARRRQAIPLDITIHHDREQPSDESDTDRRR